MDQPRVYIVKALGKKEEGTGEGGRDKEIETEKRKIGRYRPTDKTDRHRSWRCSSLGGVSVSM